MPLSLNFHRTFIPERQFIKVLLDFASKGSAGTLQEIQDETGIPMGKSTGKVPAILDYALGMGLVTLGEGKRSAIKKPELTDFGRVVFLEDKWLSEDLTQWVAHLQLCRPDIGATGWYNFFGEGRNILGNQTTPEQIESYLVAKFGPGKNRTGPLLRMYQDDAAFSIARILKLEGNKVIRNKAPLSDGYALAYSALILTLFEAFFPDESQVTTQEFNQKTHFFDTCSWGQSELERVFMFVERTKYISFDRQMQPWLIERRSDSSQVWPNIYNDLA